MTERQLKDLLEERVADLRVDDLGAAAWTAASRTRQRRSALVASAAVVAAVVAVALVVRPGSGGEPAPPAATSTAPTVAAPPVAPEVGAERGGRYFDARIWWAPPAAEESRLPELEGTSLPERVDLSGRGPAVAGLGRAVAAYEVDTDRGLDRVVVVGEDGTSYSLDVGGLVEFVDAGGSRLSPLSGESLSPDGRHVFFRQPGALAVYDFASDRWSRIEIGVGDPEFASWASEEVIEVLGGFERTGGGATYDVGGRLLERLEGSPISVDPYPGNKLISFDDEPYGPLVSLDGSQGQSAYLSGTVRRDGQALGGLEGITTRRDEVGAVLVQPPGAGRWKQCCPVIGWLDPETVLFESRHEDARVLAWRAGTRDVARVSDIRGWEAGVEVFVATYSEPAGDPVPTG